MNESIEKKPFIFYVVLLENLVECIYVCKCRFRSYSTKMYLYRYRGRELLEFHEL
jgi:hypothetical protein